jgi:hypothetical protein
MVWLSALWHVLGVLTDLGPATLLTGVVVALLALALVTLTRRGEPSSAVDGGRDAMRHNASGLVVRFADPDAPGRPRPRAPSPVPATR